MKKEYLECGKVISTHGVRGGMKIESWCDTPKVLASQKRVFTQRIDGTYQEHKVASGFPNGTNAVIVLEGISTCEAAQAYRGTVLYLHRSDIPLAKGAVLIADMIGLPLIDVESGDTLGEVTEVNDGVQGKLYTVQCPGGKEVIFPGIPEFVKEIDTERGIFVRTIPGFFD